MLVFGAVQFKSSNDGGLELICDGTHQFLTKDDVAELQNWLAYHTSRGYGTLKSNHPIRYAGLQGMVQPEPAPPEPFNEAY